MNQSCCKSHNYYTLGNTIMLYHIHKNTVTGIIFGWLEMNVDVNANCYNGAYDPLEMPHARISVL